MILFSCWAKNPHYLAYFLALYQSTPDEIAEKNKLTSRATDKYLLHLEKQELIKVTGKLKVKPVYENIPSFGQGVLAKAYFKNFIQSGADFFISHISKSLNLFNSNEK